MKGQTVSFDAVIAVAIFLLVVTLFFYIVNFAAKNRDFQEISREVESIPSKLSADATPLGFIEGNSVNKDKVEAFYGSDYAELKRKLGVAYDFCLHFEDEQGNIVQISGVDGVGSDKSSVCG